MPVFKIILHWTNYFQKSILTQGSLHLGQDLLIGNRFPALIFSDHLPHKKNVRILQQHGYKTHLGLLTDLGGQVLLGHLLGLPALGNQLPHIHVNLGGN